MFSPAFHNIRLTSFLYNEIKKTFQSQTGTKGLFRVTTQIRQFSVSLIRYGARCQFTQRPSVGPCMGKL